MMHCRFYLIIRVIKFILKKGSLLFVFVDVMIEMLNKQGVIFMKKIAIIATGGTIAGSGHMGKTTNYKAGTLSVEDILASIPSIKNEFDICLFPLLSVDSNEMNVEHWVTLKKTIDAIASLEYDGIVITHGTDTIEETAYFLTLTVHTNKPVVLTGAMRPATATSADGPFNLWQAIHLAGSSLSYGQGVLALFSSTIYSARDIQKISNYKIDAFEKANTALGFMKDDEIFFSSRQMKKHTTSSIFSSMDLSHLPQVDIVPYYAGANAQHLHTDAKGIVVMGTGSGNFSTEWKKEIEALQKEGTFFVRSSRVIDGIVFGDEVFDPHHIMIPSLTLSPYKARILLMLGLAYTQDLNTLKEIFVQY